jgi:hypothetical protein
VPTSAENEDPNQDFARRSDTESICLFCFATVRSQYPEFLDLEEQLHLLGCFSGRHKTGSRRLPFQDIGLVMHSCRRSAEDLLAASSLLIEASKQAVECTKLLIAQSRVPARRATR